MNIVYCGDLSHGATCRMRMEALQRLGHTVTGVDTSRWSAGVAGLLRRVARKASWTIPDARAGRALLSAVSTRDADLVWIDKGLTLSVSTLLQIRQRKSVQLVHYSPDDMSGPHNQSRQYLKTIPLYDLHVTTKSFNVPELYAMGARRVLFVNNAFCPCIHKPVSSRAQRDPVGFVGAFEHERARSMYYLAEHGLPVKIVGGGGWGQWAKHNPHPNLRVEHRWVWAEEYTRTICSFDINLGFLRKLNRDVQTQRSVEVPACGGFLLAERTEEHLSLFREGIEAEFFADDDELLAKCRYYIRHPDERQRIAASGRERCLRSDYSYDAHVRTALEHVRETRIDHVERQVAT